MTSPTIFLIVSVLSVTFIPSEIRGQDADGVYKIGVGIGDITGPPGGVVLVKLKKIKIWINS